MRLERDTAYYKDICNYDLRLETVHILRIQISKDIGSKIFRKYHHKIKPDIVEITLTGTYDEVEKEKEAIERIKEEIERINTAKSIINKYF